jgi:two-component system response regulator DesR
MPASLLRAATRRGAPAGLGAGMAEGSRAAFPAPEAGAAAVGRAAWPELPRVLIVDDNPAMREILRDLLDDAGFEVVSEAGDAEQGVPLAQSLAPDVVLMDVSLPGQDGLAATRRIRRLSPATRVVVFTSFDGAWVGREAIAAGASAFLAKGTPADDILEAVRRAWLAGPAGGPALGDD